MNLLMKFKRERRFFEFPIINVKEICKCMNEMRIPSDLSDVQRDASIATLMFSIASITDLIGRLVGAADSEEAEHVEEGPGQHEDLGAMTKAG